MERGKMNMLCRNKGIKKDEKGSIIKTANNGLQLRISEES